MMEHEPSSRTAAIRAAIGRTYEEAEIAPPTVGAESKIILLQKLVRGQGLIYQERPALTRASAAAFLGDRLGHDFDVPGPAAEQLSGYIYAAWESGVILVNRDDPVVRRRYTVAHELGHYLLHALPGLEAGASVFSEVQPGGRRADTEDEIGEDGEVRVIGSDAETTSGSRDWEVEANHFAAELLMPTNLCAALVEIYSPQCGGRRAVLAKRLASELLVSQQAMTYRLTDLELGRA